LQPLSQVVDATTIGRLQEAGAHSSQGGRGWLAVYEQLRRDIWDHGNFEPEKNRVSKLLTEFIAEVIAFAEPVIEGEYRLLKLRWWK
jgi:hypothetical protein